MVYATLFIALVIASLVAVSRAATSNRRIVRKWSDECPNRPSERILDIVLTMTAKDDVDTIATISETQTVDSSILIPNDRGAKVRISV